MIEPEKIFICKDKFVEVKYDKFCDYQKNYKSKEFEAESVSVLKTLHNAIISGLENEKTIVFGGEIITDKKIYNKILYDNSDVFKSYIEVLEKRCKYDINKEVN